MEGHLEFSDAVERIVERDPRYSEAAYAFVMRALGFTVARLDRPRHVTGQELLMGIRDYALEEFGLMAKTVFHHWGVQRTVDFGHVVFNLVEVGLLGKLETDRLEDFEDGFDFETAFVREYPWSAPRGGGK